MPLISRWLRWVLVLGLLCLCHAAATSAAVITRNVAYASTSGVDPNLQSLDIYAPDGAQSLPVVVGIHGGGWTGGDKQNAGFVQNKATWAIRRGYVFVSINYRLSPAVVHPAHIDDVAAAVAFVVRNIRAYGGDPDRVFVLGHSAGAHLAALVGTDESRLGEFGLSIRNIKGVIPLDTGAYDLVNGDGDAANNFVFTSFGTDPRVLRDGSPMTHVAVDKSLPPFLVLNVPRAGAHEGSALFAAVLRTAGVRVTAAEIPGTHESINEQFGVAGDAGTLLAEQFLDAELARLAEAGFGSGGLDASFQGAWWDPTRSGEGITLETSESGGQSVIGIIFYTYDLGGQPIHLVGASSVNGPVNSIAVDAVLSRGARFGDAFQASDVQRQWWGQLSVARIDCDHLRFSYASVDPNYGSGSRILERVLPRPAGVACP